MRVGVTCKRLAGFRGDRLGHAAEAPSLTACQLATGLGRKGTTPSPALSRCRHPLLSHYESTEADSYAHPLSMMTCGKSAEYTTFLNSHIPI
jgi:hypothetical protein